MSAPAPATTSPDAFAVLADIAALGAAGRELDAAVPAALERLRLALGAAGCAIWTDGDGGPLFRWTAGDALSDAVAASRVARVLAGDASDDIVALRAGGGSVGALVVHGDVSRSPLRVALLRAVADTVSPAVANAARAAQLAVEVSARTRQIEEQRRFMEKVVDSLTFGVYVIDRDYRIQAWNRKRETGMQGISRGEAIGRTIFDVLHRQPADLMRREFDDVLASGEPRQFQMESMSTGELRAYRLTKIPMRVDDRGVTHVITIGEDVTEWKAALERTAQAEKLAALGQLAAGVMHEINNPLATIAACAETMTADLSGVGATPPGFAEYLGIVDHEVQRCQRIIGGLLDFSRTKPLERTPIGLNVVLEQTLFLLKHHARFKRHLVRLDLAAADGPRVTCDVDQLTQVFMALLLNAADAIEDAQARGGDASREAAPRAITVRTRRAGDVAVVEIADDGVGIARDVLTKVFEPFFTTKEPGKGTGLGLSICYGIVGDHGGRIDVESAPGVGSTFRVTLPAT